MNNEWRINRPRNISAVYAFCLMNITLQMNSRIFEDKIGRVAIISCWPAVNNPTTGWHSNTALTQLQLQMFASEG